VLPTVTNAKELEAAVADGALWRRALRALSERHGVSLEDLIEARASFPVLCQKSVVAHAARR